MSFQSFDDDGGNSNGGNSNGAFDDNDADSSNNSDDNVAGSISRDAKSADGDGGSKLVVTLF